MATSEEQRAAAFRVELTNRAAAIQARSAALAGDPVAQAAVHTAWQPVYDYMQERASDRARREVPRVDRSRRYILRRIRLK
jgi:hypothetical protein